MPEKDVVIFSKHIIRDDWMTKGLMKSSTTLNKLYKKCIKRSKEHPSYVRYIDYRNSYNQLKRTAKQIYYQELFEKYKGDIKNTWKLLNSLIGRTKDKSSITSSFNCNGKIVNHPTDIANGFCDYFTNLGPQLANSIKAPQNDYDQYLRSKGTNTQIACF